MTKNEFKTLVNSSDPCEFHKIKGFYYRAGTCGLGKYTLDNKKDFKEVGHCNYFREKDYKTVKSELAIKINQP